ncbi:MAG: alpha/beta hydrolase fold domain-containing protein [Sutterella wadsworthensis]
MNIRKAFLHKAVPAACVLFAAGTIFAADRADLMGYVPGAEVMKVDVTDGRIDTISGIIYSQIKSQRSIRQLRMTVMTPRTKARKPAVVYFPGGGFTSADHEKFIEMRHALARAGFVVAAAEYRTVPVKFPALVEDGKAAVRYLRAHADEYGIDPERIGVIGDSAGGYLVQMLGATNGEKAFDKGDFTNVSSDVQAVCTIYGLSDLTSIGEGLDPAQAKVHASPAVTEALLVHGPAFGKSPGGSILSDREKAMNASSLGHIDGSEPPFLIMHGSGDRLVSPMQSAHLAQALRKAGTDVEYVLVEGAGHGDLPWFQKPVIERVVKFFEKEAWQSRKGCRRGQQPLTAHPAVDFNGPHEPCSLRAFLRPRGRKIYFTCRRKTY